MFHCSVAEVVRFSKMSMFDPVWEIGKSPFEASRRKQLRGFMGPSQQPLTHDKNWHSKAKYNLQPWMGSLIL